jgi:hypothetical protein
MVVAARRAASVRRHLLRPTPPATRSTAPRDGRVHAGEGGFDGTVRFFFQPAEEHGLGAQAMIEDGVLERRAGR